VHGDLGARLNTVLDSQELGLLRLVARAAEKKGMPLYAVGGLPRDLILGRALNDFDLVVEGDAVELARALASRHGGSVTPHRRFGTATWRWQPAAEEGHAGDVPPMRRLVLDLITARTEIYPHPGQLPQVRPATIEEDLRRRDFSINAIGIRLDGRSFGLIADPLHGIEDIRSRRVRVLHDRSFLDDPTRMYRAVRYEQRLGFHITADTRSLMKGGKAWVSHVSGHRLRRELDLILGEQHCAMMLRRLYHLGLLQRVHARLPADARSLRRLSGKFTSDQTEANLPDSVVLGTQWRLWLLDLKPAAACSVGRRLAFGGRELELVLAASALYRSEPKWANLQPSKLTVKLDHVPVPAIETVRAALPAGKGRGALESYLSRWRHVRPVTTGRDLADLGMQPGPRYRAILQALRAAWIDGKVQDAQGERVLLERLIRRAHHRSL
jgi:tRNA nucleotidyltransferase (CCA-adding enzyme)